MLTNAGPDCGQMIVRSCAEKKIFLFFFRNICILVGRSQRYLSNVVKTADFLYKSSNAHASKNRMSWISKLHLSNYWYQEHHLFTDPIKPAKMLAEILHIIFSKYVSNNLPSCNVQSGNNTANGSPRMESSATERGGATSSQAFIKHPQYMKVHVCISPETFNFARTQEV